jgi:hypothetical protein
VSLLYSTALLDFRSGSIKWFQQPGKPASLLFKRACWSKSNARFTSSFRFSRVVWLRRPDDLLFSDSAAEDQLSTMSEKDRQLKRILREVVDIGSESLEAHLIIEQFKSKNLTESQAEELCKLGAQKLNAINEHTSQIIDVLKVIAEKSGQW